MDLDELLHRRRPSQWSLFISSPTLYITRLLYAIRRQPSDGVLETQTEPIMVVCISDTHNKQPSLPYGDILIHAGDLTQLGTQQELQDQIDWLDSQPHPHKFVIAGNHDKGLASFRNADTTSSAIPDSDSENTIPTVQLNWGSITYLSNSSSTITIRERTLKIFGSPWTRKNGNWVFQYPHEHGGDVWFQRIPDDTDILVTHGPLKGHLDTWDAWGCEWLLKEVWRVVGRQRRLRLRDGSPTTTRDAGIGNGNGDGRLRLCVFGHIHDGYGVERVWFDEFQRLYEEMVIANSDARKMRRDKLSLATWVIGTVSRWSVVVKMVWVYVCSRIGVGYVDGAGRSDDVVQLVNAAHVGGLRDRTLRNAIVVSI